MMSDNVNKSRHWRASLCKAYGGRTGFTSGAAWRCAVMLMLLFLGTADLSAQFPGGFPFGGGAGQQGNQQRSRSGTSSSTRAYPNNQVGDAVISIDPETRHLIVIADDDTSQYISQVISNLDRPKPQVLIKVVFLELTRNDSSDIGVEGGFTSGTNDSTFAAIANAFGLSGLNLPGSGTNAPPVNALGQPVTSFIPTPPGAGVYQILGQDYQVTLRAIAQAGKAKILSRPSVVARNNQPATILVGQTVPLITSVRYDSLGNAINGITYTDVGIILRVTPFITPDGLVEMIVSPETSAVSETESVQIQNATFAPVIDKRSADTVVVTPDGQTVILGGMMQNIKADAENKIPFLGDIPWIGNLFKRKIKSATQTELLIFLTPHIIQAPGEFAALSDGEAQKSDIPQGLSEEELRKYLEGIQIKQTKPPAKKRR